MYIIEKKVHHHHHHRILANGKFDSVVRRFEDDIAGSRRAHSRHVRFTGSA